MRCIGGSNLGAKVRNIMKAAFKDEVLQNVSWTGVGKCGKERFQDFKTIVKCIKAASDCEKNTEYDVINHMKNWIRHAKERLISKK